MCIVRSSNHIILRRCKSTLNLACAVYDRCVYKFPHASPNNATGRKEKMSANLELLTAVCSAILCYPVVTHEEYQREKQRGVWVENYHLLDIDQLFRLSHSYAGSALDGERQDETPVRAERFPSNDDQYDANAFTLFVKMTNGKTIPIIARKDELVSDVKARVCKKACVSSDQVRLMRFCGRSMMDNKCLSDYSVDPNTNLFLCPRLVGGSTPKCYLDAKMLDASFNYDFTNMRDDGTKFYRGGKPYYRPYGWYRHALKVRGKYDDDLWLGDDGICTHSCPGKWPVAYHGTTENNCRNIAQKGYDLSKGK